MRTHFKRVRNGFDVFVGVVDFNSINGHEKTAARHAKAECFLSNARMKAKMTDWCEFTYTRAGAP